VGLAQFIAICGLGLLGLLEPDVFLREGMWGLASGILSSAIVMIILPVFEFLFEITTDITLLELSDLNRPLLRRMVLEAPGTYHHSLMVGNLAEAASDAIGANSLLARVGAYYHDIGKIEKSEYFSENETECKSHHEGLTPSMSALIITSHVKDGVEIAKKYKLNRTITDFIAQHHGTGLIYYFYQRALEKVDDDDALKEEGFRYPGPKPQTKEAAIVLLADSVEAASRALDDPTPARIESLVQKIINNKFIDSQLDECELTLKDMHKISKSFVRILTGTFHTRVEYPENGKGKAKTKNSK
jgi:cyclic-di-AMP phosphodiesterase PgpH